MISPPPTITEVWIEITEVWIVDPRGRLPGSLERELVARGLTPRFWRASPITRIPEMAPAAVLFADVDHPLSNFVAGLASAAPSAKILWLGWQVPGAPDHWRMPKFKKLPQRGGLALARSIGFCIRKRRAAVRNAALAPPEWSTTS